MKFEAINPELRGARYASSYKSNVVLAANTPETVFTPAANTKGAWVWSMQIASRASTSACALAKTSAPTTAVDGDAILSPDMMGQIGGDSACGASLKHPVFIPPGKGLYFISTTLEVGGQRGCLYSLLV